MTASEQPALKWSTQYRIASTALATQAGGDKILLPPSALEQLLSASSELAAANARRELPHYDPFNSATYSAYRQAESQYQDQRQQLPYPLTFRLVNPDNGRVVYAGIREFSAEEGEIALSPFLTESLGLSATEPSKQLTTASQEQSNNHEAGYQTPSQSVTVHFQELPKGTFVKLRPLEAGYDVEDWKALLEQHLRSNYTTLTNGETLIIPGGKSSGGKREEFRFLVDGFKPDVDGVCIVDTDLEVDIEALDEEQARETLKRIAAKSAKAPGTDQGSSRGGDLDIFKEQEGQVLPGDYVDYRLPSWDRTSPLEVVLVAHDDTETLDLLVSPLSATQRANPRMDEFVFADLEARPKKRIRLEPTNIELEHAEALFITVHKSQANDDSLAPSRFTLRSRHASGTTGVDLNEQSRNEDVPPNEGEVRCKNCHQWVPQRTLMLHENFCLRNNVLCPKGCGQVFQKRSPAFQDHWHCPHDSSFGNSPQSHHHHDDLFHPLEVLRCPECSTSETFPNIPSLAQHRTTTCPAKPILCRFCHLVVPQEGDPDVPNAEALLTGMTPHELADGARTTECHLCNKIVRLRDMETHLRNHDLDRLSRPPPVPCRNLLCGRTQDVCAHNGDTRAGARMGQGAGNDIGLCSTCFGPLYVSMYDPEGKALKRRVERRYLQQLTVGCGKDWCRNEFCKAGRKHLELNSNVTMKDALPMVKPYVADSTTAGAGTPLHFCVDEASQNRRGLAAMLAAEEGDPTKKGGYDMEWCLGALEAEKGDLDAARQWLKNWAPARQEGRR